MKKILFIVCLICSCILSKCQIDNWYIGTSDNWYDPNNWSLGKVPDNNDVAIISNKTVTIRPHPISINIVGLVCVNNSFITIKNNIIINRSLISDNTSYICLDGCTLNSTLSTILVQNMQLRSAKVIPNVIVNRSLVVKQTSHIIGNIYVFGNLTMLMSSTLTVDSYYQFNNSNLIIYGINFDSWYRAPIIYAKKVDTNGYLFVLKYEKVQPTFCWGLFNSANITNKLVLMPNTYQAYLSSDPKHHLLMLCLS